MTTKPHWIRLWVLFLLASAAALRAQGEPGGWEPGAVLAEGIRLGAKKKLSEAKAKFEGATDYWEVHASARLYLKVIEDVQRGIIKDKVARDLFRALQNPKRDKALKQAEKLIKKNQGYLPLYVIRGELLKSLERDDGAEVAFVEAADLAPDSSLPALFLGRFYAESGRNREAIRAFDRVLARHPGLAIAHFERGFVRVLEKDYDGAVRDFETAVKGYPAWGKSAVVKEAFFSRGVRALEKKAYRRAIADLTRAIEIDSNYVTSYLNRGLAYKSQKAYARAIADFAACLERDPNYQAAYFHRGDTQFARGRYQAAAQDLARAVELAPDDKRAHFKLAECYYQMRRFALALQHFDRVLALDPDDYWAYYQRGFVHRDAGQARQAAQSFKRFLALAPKKYYKQIAHAEMELKKLNGYGR